MPGFDGTGPRGIGPMTGGGRGYCSSSGIRTVWRPYSARRWPGYGYGYGYGYPASPVATREQEIDILRNEAQTLKRTLEEIDARIKALSGEEK
ncbi:MAG: DUF5320 domain-containing protein [Dehalococcoidales bacterium]|nr:DUF5320 domain-containing protein [Dehalococcoidales bacterium]